MTRNRQSFLKKISLRDFCVAILLAVFLILAGARFAFAADVSANLTVTEAKLFQGNRELSVESGATGSFYARIDWRYESENPIASGDTASFAFGTQNYNQNNTNFHVRNSKDLPINNEDGQTLGYWNITNRRINIRFTDAAVGHYILEGTIITDSNICASDSVASDRVVYFPIADKRIAFTRKASTFRTLPDDHAFSNLATNGTLYWDYYTPGITANEFYKGNGQVEFTDKAKLSNLSYETTLSSLATGAAINIYALAQLPLDINNVTAGAASAAFWINTTKLFTRKNQVEGQGYDDWFAEMNDGEYGIYKDENGRLKVAVKFGSQPSNITYAQAMAASGRSGMRVGEGYVSMPEAKDILNLLDTPGTVSGGKVLRFVAEIQEFIPSTSGGTRVSNTAEYGYLEENGGDVGSAKDTTVTVPVGSASAIIIGEARLRLVDEDTGAPLSGRKFILQVQDGEQWEDVPNTERTTDNDGRIQVLNLMPGNNYRWLQIDFADHYDRDSLKVRVDQQATRRGAQGDNADFTMPTNAGISFTATNTLESYTITYELGVGSDDDDIVYRQHYGETTQQPDMNTVSIREGYVFEGWNKAIKETVTSDATYVAKWSSVTRAVTDGTMAESVPGDVAGGASSDNIQPPLTLDGYVSYWRIMGLSAALSLYFVPRVMRAYRVRRYRK